MLRTALHLAGLTVALAALPLALSAQSPAGSGEPATASPTVEQTPATALSAEARRAELESIRKRLNQLQEQALADSALKAQEASVGELIVSTMRSLDAGYDGKVARFNELRAEIAAAAQDAARQQALQAELKQIQADFAATRQKALQDAAVAGKQAELRQSLFSRMLAIDPQADDLVRRMQELQRAQSAGQSTGG